MPSVPSNLTRNGESKCVFVDKGRGSPEDDTSGFLDRVSSEPAWPSASTTFMSTIAPNSDSRSTVPTNLAEVTVVPWRELSSRIRETLARRNCFVASSEDLRVLWQEERVDSLERRRRITVFAAQHHWKVETRADGHSARFLVCTPSGLISRESLSRNHE